MSASPSCASVRQRCLEQLVVELVRAQLRQRARVPAQHEQRVVLDRLARRDHLAAQDPGSVREQRQQRLVLDRLQPAQPELRAAVPVPDQSD